MYRMNRYAVTINANSKALLSSDLKAVMDEFVAFYDGEVLVEGWELKEDGRLHVHFGVLCRDEIKSYTMFSVKNFQIFIKKMNQIGRWAHYCKKTSKSDGQNEEIQMDYDFKNHYSFVDDLPEDDKLAVLEFERYKRDWFAVAEALNGYCSKCEWHNIRSPVYEDDLCKFCYDQMIGATKPFNQATQPSSEGLLDPNDSI